MTRADKILIGGILALGLLFFSFGRSKKNRDETSWAVIRSGGQIIAEIDLSQSDQKVIQIEGPLGISQAKIEGNSIRMLSSPCPDKICIQQGKIRENGQSIVCVPNKVSISIESKGGIDEITR